MAMRDFLYIYHLYSKQIVSFLLFSMLFFVTFSVRFWRKNSHKSDLTRQGLAHNAFICVIRVT